MEAFTVTLVSGSQYAMQAENHILAIVHFSHKVAQHLHGGIVMYCHRREERKNETADDKFLV